MEGANLALEVSLIKTVINGQCKSRSQKHSVSSVFVGGDGPGAGLEVSDDGTFPADSFPLIANGGFPSANRRRAWGRTGVLRGLTFRGGFLRLLGFCVPAGEGQSRGYSAELGKKTEWSGLAGI
jgi:hypothetical protein